MVNIRFETQSLDIKPGDNLLQTLHGAGIDIPFGCRSGICQSCLVRASDGEIPETAQRGLGRELIRTGHLLACRCWPEKALVLERATRAPTRYVTRLLAKSWLNDTVLAIRLERPRAFGFRAGQYLTIWRNKRQGRAYSLVNPSDEDALELHVRVYPGGRVSPWLANSLEPGAPVMIQGPAGECGYDRGFDAPLLLMGAGVGIGAMVGVLKEALAAGHRQSITLLHAVRHEDDLYLDRELASIRRQNVEYRHFVGAGILHPSALEDELERIASSFADHHIQLCGSPRLVIRVRRQLFLAGAASNRIIADPFEFPAKQDVAVR